MKNIFIPFLIILLVFLINHSLFQKKRNNINKSLTGLIKIVGNVPFTNAVLETDEKKHYYLPEDFIKNNNKIIGKRVTLKGNIKKEVIKSADHKYQITKYYIENIKIIKVF